MHLKLEFFELDVLFYTKDGVIEVLFVMFSYKTHISERSFSSITSDLLDFHTNKTEQYLQTNVSVLEKNRVLLAIQAELKLAVLLLFGRDRLSGKLRGPGAFCFKMTLERSKSRF